MGELRTRIKIKDGVTDEHVRMWSRLVEIGAAEIADMRAALLEDAE